ncbi:MAG: tRNA (5-methylaminomethyl-2-thiouridine)(34)-methyltransferase MnmD [Bacteroidota bacterium]
MADLKHVQTRDGSSTLYAPRFEEHYHSLHGAVQESMHVFIEMGLRALPKELEQVRIFEMGFGTGLNALLTLLHRGEKKIKYVGIEAYPIQSEQWESLNYPQELGEEAVVHFRQLHESAWETPLAVVPGFGFEKRQQKLEDLELSDPVDLIYFDAFAPTAQPELWTDAVMQRMADLLAPGGIFVTYSAKGSVRRALQAAGLVVEKLPGPPGKREMLRGRRGDLRSPSQ